MGVLNLFNHASAVYGGDSARPVMPRLKFQFLMDVPSRRAANPARSGSTGSRRRISRDITVDTDVVNQYNRRRVVMKRVEFSPGQPSTFVDTADHSFSRLIRRILRSTAFQLRRGAGGFHLQVEERATRPSPPNSPAQQAACPWRRTAHRQVFLRPRGHHPDGRPPGGGPRAAPLAPQSGHHRDLRRRPGLRRPARPWTGAWPSSRSIRHRRGGPEPARRRIARASRHRSGDRDGRIPPLPEQGSSRQESPRRGTTRSSRTRP